MQALAKPPLRPQHSNNQSTLLSPISWQTYENLLKDLDEDNRVRLIYNQGHLEIIMSPLLPLHEISSTLIHNFIIILGDELDIDIRSLGSTTLRRQDLQRGLEPDKSYYIQHESIVRDKQKLDLNQLPPPDLVVEIDITNSSESKFPIYFSLGVPEIWLYDGEMLYLYQKTDQEYLTSEVSSAFGLPVHTVIPAFINKSFSVSERIILREFRQWVKEQIKRL